MPFDVFGLRDHVVRDYRDYVESFINIRDKRIEGFVDGVLDAGELWPDAVLQLNPAFESGPTLGELAAKGIIGDGTARFFGPNIRLHRHQAEAIAAATARKHFVVSTGTGSGKSLAYLVPIVDHVLKNKPADHSVRAIIVYPMNALINSQLKALQDFQRNWPECPVTFGRYTGQDRGPSRDRILTDPPHILLTNYVMLEYMLIRPADRPLVHQATRALRFLAVDEMHVYRGRQGADVAMLMRRVRQKAGKADVLAIGTSATIASGTTRAEAREAIAAVGTRFFGVPVSADTVIDETLRRITTVRAPTSAAELRAAVEALPPAATVEAVTRHPLAAWVEITFGLGEDADGRLIRRKPLAFEEGLAELVRATGLPADRCRERLKAVLEAGNRAERRPGEPVFAFRLHQFLSSGGSVYTTLETPETRSFSTDGPFFAPKEDGKPDNRVMFPLAFCRECGQEHYLCSLSTGADGGSLLPRSPLLHVTDDDLPGEPGFVTIEDGSLWGEDEDLPDNFVEMRAAGPRVKTRYGPHVPRRIYVTADGKASPVGRDGALPAWWQPRPLMLCLRCRAAYDLRESDYRKLVTLSQTGRSTATTVLGTGVVTGLGAFGFTKEDGPSRLLSFTDNRQDASLQAGHTNDFVQVVQLRAALVAALRSAQGNALAFDALGAATFEALDPRPEHFMKEPVEAGPGFVGARSVMIQLLHYLAMEDLARAWRVAQPNLEQTGLLRLEYVGLDDLAEDSSVWLHPVMRAASPDRRRRVVAAILDHMRSVLVIDDKALTDDETKRLVQRTNAVLRDPWAFDEHERLRRGGVATLPDVIPAERDRDVTLRLGPRSAVSRYLRSRRTWGTEADLRSEDVKELVAGIVATLRGHILHIVERRGEPFGVQIAVSALRWRLGEGSPPPPDPVRGRSLHLRREDEGSRGPNAYFTQLYQRALGSRSSSGLKGIRSAEHTGAVPAERREERERAFNTGELSLLFCSPTMELGVDIRDLSVVHMRNIPPTPANYAQRSGRAGRGGKAALVLAFASHGNVHDQYFFHKSRDMIAGVVSPPRIDLANKELIEAHLNSTWLSILTPDLGKGSVSDVLDLQVAGYPVEADQMAPLLQDSRTRRPEIRQAMRDVLGSAGAEVESAPWFSEAWVDDIAEGAPHRFARAFDRWRELYKAATEQRDTARKIIDNPRSLRKDRDTAEQREREAKREIQLLLNESGISESEFYIYRYLSNEGLLPGYNFPRLPVRALISSGTEAHSIDRPRFLGLTEFGPGNTLYYEGRKHRVSAVVLPASGIEGRLTRAKLCLQCGYAHPSEQADVDLCVYCGTRLDGSTSQYPQTLFEQPTVRAQRWTRITSEEEERVREGYVTTTHFNAAQAARRERLTLVHADSGDALLSIAHLPQAQLWRINHGWRKASEQAGFIIDPGTGRWRAKEDAGAEEGAPPGTPTSISGLKPYVTDSRNLLLLRPVSEDSSESFLTSLAYALRRALQVEYQLEEQEVVVETIGREDQEALLFWEAAEGGIGVWERLTGDPRGFRALARRALGLLHFEADTGAEQPGWADRCTAACYQCLLSYSNQRDHRHLDRHRVRGFLQSLAACEIASAAEGRPYDDEYHRLIALIDPASTFERAFLDHLYRNRLRLPDHAQHTPAEGIPIQPDFYYKRNGIPGVCVFVDGPPHQDPRRKRDDLHLREALRDQGFRVIALVADRGLDEQLREHLDVFEGAR